jgi:hypothetical protein
MRIIRVVNKIKSGKIKLNLTLKNKLNILFCDNSNLGLKDLLSHMHFSGRSKQQRTNKYNLEFLI